MSTATEAPEATTQERLAAGAKKAAMATEYVVLRELDDARGDCWIVHNDSCRAASAEAAVRISIADTDTGRYVAIPARSWKPVQVKVATVTKVTLEAA